jgi:hypothetical protein
MRMRGNLIQKIRLVICLLLMCIGGVFVVSSSAALAQSRQTDEILKLKQLYDRKQYFELRAAVENYHGKADARLLFFRGAIANIFYQPQASTKYLNQYIAQVGDKAWLSDAYTLLADNFVKLYDYGKAADAYQTILNRFKQTLKPDEIKDYENVATLYNSLRVVPRQTVLIGKPGVLNKASAEHGWNVPVEANRQRVNLGLDTGANISLLAKSTADKLGVKMIDQSISFGSITSISVQPKLGFLPTMRIGSAMIHNAIFIVLDDQALTFPDGFMLKGVIGFPVIAGLRHISFNHDGTVSVSGNLSGAGRANMCLDSKNILFQGDYENQEFTFMLDTGAERSILYLPFLQEFATEIKTKYSLRTEKFTGVGGTEEVPAYIVKEFALKLSGKEARLPEIRLLTKALTDSGKFYYGNIGEDLIKRFQRMTLDFASMRIVFE